MLIDTNVIIEIGRNQEHKQECIDLLNAINQHQFSEARSTTTF